MESQESLKKSEFARRIGVVPGRVSQMLKMGLPEMKDGTIPWPGGKEWYDSHISEKGRPAKGKPTDPTTHVAATLESNSLDSQSKIPDLHLLGVDVQKIMEALRLPKVEYEKLVLIQRRVKLELENQTKKGKLLDRDEVEAAAFEQSRVERDYWLNWPSRVSPVMAAELNIDERKLYFMLERHVRECLEERPISEHLMPESRTA